MRNTLAISAALLVVASQPVLGYEEPNYKVLAQHDAYEIRAYEPILVAEATVKGDLVTGGNRAFRILAGYIFGKNTKPHAPSSIPTSSTASQDESVKMSMTVPVMSYSSVGDGNAKPVSTFQFVMERSYNIDSLPIPNDPRVSIRTLPPQHVAALRYSGRTTKSNFDKHLRELSAHLAKDGYVPHGPPRAAVYNGPFTLPFMRRNEVLVPVRLPDTP